MHLICPHGIRAILHIVGLGGLQLWPEKPVRTWRIKPQLLLPQCRYIKHQAPLKYHQQDFMNQMKLQWLILSDAQKRSESLDKDKTKPVRVTKSKLERLLKLRALHTKEDPKERAVVDAAIDAEADRYERRGKK